MTLVISCFVNNITDYFPPRLSVKAQFAEAADASPSSQEKTSGKATVLCFFSILLNI